MTTKNPSIVLLMSGGLDSAMCALLAKARFPTHRILALAIDYGQRNDIELNAARSICALLHLPLRIERAPGLLRGTSPLLTHAAPREYSSAQQAVTEAAGDTDPVFIPLRNALFLLIAANYAMVEEAEVVVSGLVSGDGTSFPDAQPPFLDAMTTLVHTALGKRSVYFWSPLITETKAQSIKRVASMGALAKEVIARSYSCYYGRPRPCGRCRACVTRAQAFHDAGIDDPALDFPDLDHE